MLPCVLMNYPESLQFADHFATEIVDANLLLAAIDQRLEQVEANENVIERYEQMDAMLELRDSIEAEQI